MAAFCNSLAFPGGFRTGWQTQNKLTHTLSSTLTFKTFNFRSLEKYWNLNVCKKKEHLDLQTKPMARKGFELWTSDNTSQTCIWHCMANAFPPAELVANDRNRKSNDENSKDGANSSNQTTKSSDGDNLHVNMSSSDVFTFYLDFGVILLFVHTICFCICICIFIWIYLFLVFCWLCIFYLYWISSSIHIVTYILVRVHIFTCILFEKKKKHILFCILV